MNRDPLLLPTLVLSAGIWIGKATAVPWATAMGTTAALVLLFALLSVRSMFGLGRIAAPLLAAFLFAGFLFGRLRTPKPCGDDVCLVCPANGEPVPVELEGYLLETPVRYDDRLVFRFRAEKATLGGKTARVSGKVRFALYGPDEGRLSELEFRYGDRVVLTASLRRPRDFMNPGHLPFVQNLAFDGIFCIGAIKNRLLIRKGEGKGGNPLASLFDELQVFGKKQIDRFFAENREKSGEAGNFTEAILFGRRENLSPETSWTFKRTGVYHILAISGFNVAIVLAGAHFLFRSARIPHFASNVLLIVLAFFYAGLTGFSSSVTRAALMASLYLLGKSFQRDVSLWNTLAASAMLILLFKPMEIFNGGFQLSFASTASLIGLGPLFKTKMPSFPSFVSNPLSATLAAQVGVLPMMAGKFFLVSPVSLVMNLVAAVAVTACIFIGFGYLLACCLWNPIPAALAKLLEMIYRFMMACLESPGDHPIFFYRIPGPPLWLSFCYYSSLLLSFKNGWTGKLGLALYFACLVLVLGHPFPESSIKGMRLTVLDVGTGDAILCELPRGTRILIDGGGFPRRSAFDPGEEIVSRYLWSQGFKHLDIVIATHPHWDHCGGLQAVLRNFSVSELWVPGVGGTDPLTRALLRTASSRGVFVRRIGSGMIFRFGENIMEVLHPRAFAGASSGKAPNDCSIVIRLVTPEVSVLFTGDIEIAVEERLLRDYGDALRSDILKVPHHGNISSFDEDFIKAVSSRVAVISCGSGGGAEQKSRNVVAGLRGMGVNVYSTDENGMIEVSEGFGSLKIRTYAGGSPAVDLPVKRRREGSAGSRACD